MAVLGATFVPGESPSTGLRDAMSLVESQNSAMDRAQRRRLLEERASQERQLFNQQQAEYIATAPVRDATRRMEIASAQGKIAAGVQMQDLMTSAQSEMPNLRARWNATTQLEDPEERLMEQERVLGMADRFAGLKDVGSEIHQWHNLWAQATINQRTRDQLSGRLATAQIGADAKIKTAQEQTARSSMIQDRTDARATQAIDARKTRTADSIAAMDAAATAAEQEGNTELAKSLRDHIKKQNAIHQASNSVADILKQELNKPAAPESPGLVDRAMSALGFGSKANASPAEAQKKIAQPKTREERDKLEKGTPYIGPDGRTYIKGD